MPSRLDARVAQHDREIAAIRKLILTGMKMLNRTDATLDRMAGEQEQIKKEFRLLAEEQRLLAAEQRRTEKLMQRWLERSTNGHK